MNKVILGYDQVEKKIHMSELIKYRNEYGKKCLHPESSELTCSKISGAHNIQRRGPLEQLQQNNHILMPIVNGYSGNLELKSQGIMKEATVFHGLCNKHDKIFNPIEQGELGVSISNQEAFLFSYRAFLYSYFKVIREDYCYKRLNKKYDYRNHKYIVDFYKRLEENVEKIKLEKMRFDNCIVNKDYEKMTTSVFRLNQKIQFAASTAFELRYDGYGNPIAIDHQEMALIYFTIIPNVNDSYIIISWFNNFDKYYNDFKNQIDIFPTNFLKKYLNNILPLYAENIILSPRLWNDWSSDQQDDFMDVIQQNLVTGYLSSISSEHFKERSYNLFI